MKQQNIDAYLIQETHLAVDFERHLINDYYIIHHGPEKQPTHGAKGGVAIILSPQMTLQWKTGNKEKKKIIEEIPSEIPLDSSASQSDLKYQDNNSNKK